MHRSWLLVAVVLAALRVEAAAQEASFDCLKAATPVELLICSDPELLALDSAVGEALTAQRHKLPEAQRAAALAEQRTWLAERLTRCSVPAKGETLPLELRWQAAPCLDEMYRARLAALGVPPQPVEPAPPEAAAPGFIHPACLWPIVEEDPEATPQAGPRIPVAACSRGNRHIPVSLGEEGGFSAPAAADGGFTWLSYRPVGRLADGREAVIVWYNAGGTGVFSELYLLRRTPTADRRDTLLGGELLGGGGDRCNGGIEQATLLDDRTLQVDYRVTPQDLLAEGDEELANDNIDALAFCAVCCTGTVRRKLDLASKQETTVAATVDELLTEGTDGGDAEPAQACFDGVIRKAAGSLPHTFTAPELRALAQTFANTCLKK